LTVKKEKILLNIPWVDISRLASIIIVMDDWLVDSKKTIVDKIGAM